MYYRRSNGRSKKPLIIAVAAFLLVMILSTVSSMLISRKKEEAVSETPDSVAAADLPMTEMTETLYKMVIYTSDEGSVEVSGGTLLFVDTDKSTYEIAEDGEVQLTVRPAGTKPVMDVSVLDGSAKEIPYSAKQEEAGVMIFHFTMPASEVFVSLSYGTDTVETGSNNADSNIRYGIALDGVTDSVKTSFDGKFNAILLVNSIGDWFLTDPEYEDVDQVTMLQKDYEGEKKESHVYQYLCFNEEDDWLILADYNMLQDSYTFRDIRKEKQEEERLAQESEAREESERLAREAEEAASAAAQEKEEESRNRRAASQTSDELSVGVGDETVTSASSFKLTGVPQAFLTYVGADEEKFCRKVYDYALKQGCTGNIKAKFKTYSIEKKKKICSFAISLGNGSLINGKYKKSSGKYSFEGL